MPLNTISSYRRPASTLLLATLLALAGCGGGSLSPSIDITVTPPSVTPPAGTLAQADALAQFDNVWKTFDQNYAYFDYKKIDWNALNAEFRPQAAQVRSQDALNAVLLQMLGRLHDNHVRLVASDGSFLRSYLPTAFVNWDLNVLGQYFTRWHGTQVTPVLGYATVPNGAYIGVSGWDTAQLTEASIDSAMEAVKDSPALIIDMRPNPGGNDSLAMSMFSRLTTVPRVGDYIQLRNGPLHSDLTPLTGRTINPRGAWQYTRPIILLTGRQTASSSESFVSFMRTLPNVTVMGDTTAGTSGNPGPFTLTSQWSFTVSRWINYTADHEVIEDKGIAPHIPVPATAADFQAGRDPVLDAALARLAQLK